MKLKKKTWYWMLTPSMKGEWHPVYINIYGQIVIDGNFFKQDFFGKDALFQKAIMPTNES